MTYTIYRAPGWHNEPTDPVIGVTDDEHEAAMMAGERCDIKMPGSCNAHDCYALNENSERVEPIESFRCDNCGELVEWPEYGPIGAMGGRILECPDAVEKHLVTWLCESCAEQWEDDDEDE